MANNNNNIDIDTDTEPFDDLTRFKQFVDADHSVNLYKKHGVQLLSVLHLASNDLSMVKYLIESHASCIDIDINALDTEGKIPLHYAAWVGKVEIIKYLIDHGANIHAKSYNLNTCLHFAAANCHFEAVKYFLDIGIDKGELNAFGYTAAGLVDSGHWERDVVIEYIESYEYMPTKGVNGDI